jgi:hypothetical protein
MDTVILVNIDREQGKYVVYDEVGTVLLGPFYSHRDPAVMGQRLADSLNRKVYRPDADHPSGTSDCLVFLPQSTPTQK